MFKVTAYADSFTPYYLWECNTPEEVADTAEHFLCLRPIDRIVINITDDSVFDEPSTLGVCPGL